jgi:predicted phosphodiesterase
MSEFKGDNVDCIVFGHSHRPMNEMVKKVLLFNPGSPTDKIFAPYNSYGVIELKGELTADIIKL